MKEYGWNNFKISSRLRYTSWNEQSIVGESLRASSQMSLRVKPMFILCKILGTAPYSFDSESSKAKFEPSIIGLVYAHVIAGLLAWFAIINYETTSFNLSSGSHVTIVAQWLQFYVNNGFPISIIIANSFQQWKVVEVFNDIFQRKENRRKIPETPRSRSGKDLFYGTCIVLLVIFIHSFTTLTSYYDNEKRIDYYWFPYGILLLVDTLIIAQFSWAVLNVGFDFRSISQRLRALTNLPSNDRIAFNNAETTRFELKIIAQEHLTLTNVTSLLNSAYSYQLLLCFVAGLIISVSGLYLTCKKIIQYNAYLLSYGVDPEQESVFNWWALTCYPVSHLVLLISIIWVCHWTTNQSTSGTAYLLRLRRTPACGPIIDAFCQQCMLQRVSFNVLDLFEIRPSMICAIITTVLTYLIILVQFEISQDVSDIIRPDVLNSNLGG